MKGPKVSTVYMRSTVVHFSRSRIKPRKILYLKMELLVEGTLLCRYDERTIQELPTEEEYSAAEKFVSTKIIMVQRARLGYMRHFC